MFDLYIDDIDKELKIYVWLYIDEMDKVRNEGRCLGWLEVPL